MDKGMKKKTAELFKRTVWHDQFNYECNLCAYATLDALKMAGHLRMVHGVDTGVGVRAVAPEPEREPVVLIEESEIKEGA